MCFLIGDCETQPKLARISQLVIVELLAERGSTLWGTKEFIGKRL